MKWSDDDKYLLCGTDGGEIYIRPRDNIDSYLQIRNHDQNEGKIKGIGFNYKNNALMTTSEDGTLICKKIDYNYLSEASKIPLVEPKIELSDGNPSDTKNQSQLITSKVSNTQLVNALPEPKYPILSGGIDEHFFKHNFNVKGDSDDV